MAQSMIERVAKSIFETWARESGVSATWDEITSLGHPHVDLAHKEARAAIEAMREPSEAMNIAGEWPAEDDGSAGCWKAMIDAALAKET